ncbi:hypothetical protein B5807_09210 [Epicoccum nigrum]|uniref:Uncharacterized protein n=1 Tax=Epicoccum nigrum TaxID=105696 RepID=A0A1Y2LMU0_EPING|nr:hypothetical protein B5807_09210 [Epicoccum nigrum]
MFRRFVGDQMVALFDRRGPSGSPGRARKISLHIALIEYHRKQARKKKDTDRVVVEPSIARRKASIASIASPRPHAEHHAPPRSKQHLRGRPCTTAPDFLNDDQHVSAFVGLYQRCSR